MANAIPMYQAFINWLFTTEGIYVPTKYHDRCGKIEEMLDNDVSGLINTVLDYSIDSASETDYSVECTEETLQKLLNLWLQKINLNVQGVPSGIKPLSQEYYKERWQGSSFCILRVKDWEEIEVNNVKISVPTTLAFVNGASIYVKRPDGKNKDYVLGTDEYYLDKELKNKIPKEKDELIIVQKPYDRWFDEYSTPYLIRKGVYKNWLGIKTLQDKSDEVITKVLPYLFLIIKGDKDLFLRGDVDYTDDELQDLTNNFKSQVEKYKNEKGKTPTNAVPFDTKYEHLIPDLGKILREELYRQGFRSILAGLGFVDMLEIAPSRQESRLNPKAFIAEINGGVDGFKSILLEVVYKIIERNRSKHTKLFEKNKKIIIVNSHLRINIEQMLEDLRSGYDRGVMSIETYQGILGLDPDTERERRQKEFDNGLEDLMYPHLTQNREDIPDRLVPTKPKNERDENLNKKKGSPESKNFKAEIEEAESKYIRLRQKDPDDFEEDSFRIITLSKEKGIKAVIGRLKGQKTTTVQSYLFDKEKWTEDKAKKWVEEHSRGVELALEMLLNEPIDYNLVAIKEEDLEIAPYTMQNYPKYLNKYPKHAIEIWVKTFNEVYEKTGDESKAFPIAWNALKRYMKKQKGEEK